MIEINLLPSERRKKTLELPKFPLLPVGMGILGILVTVNFTLGLMVGRRNAQIKRLTEEWELNLPSKQQADAISSTINELRTKKEVMDSLIGRRFLWSKKLNLLSDLIPRGIWLTRLSLDEKGDLRFLTLWGLAMPFKGQEMVASVTKFMDALKEDKEFFEGFEAIELGPIKRKKVEKIEVMKFTLVCQLAGESNKAQIYGTK